MTRGALHPAAVGLSKLEVLDLSRNFLSSETFPPSPYLANLRILILHGNNLQRIPEVRFTGLQIGLVLPVLNLG